MLVCVCNGISDRDIQSSIEGGARSFSDIREQLGIASSCGQCASFAKDMISEKLGNPNASHAFHLGRQIAV